MLRVVLDLTAGSELSLFTEMLEQINPQQPANVFHIPLALIRLLVVLIKFLRRKKFVSGAQRLTYYVVYTKHGETQKLADKHCYFYETR